MEWFKDNTKIWIVIALLVICFFWAMSSTLALNKARNENQENLARRLTMEERYEGIVKARADIEQQVTAFQQQLEQQKILYSDTLTELNQEKIVVRALKEEALKLNDKLQAQGKAQAVR